MPGRELGIKAGEIWAFRRGTSHPLVAVRIVDPGKHYDARIIIEQVLNGRSNESTTRSHLLCKWDQVDEYVALHAAKMLQIDRDPKPAPALEPKFIKPLDENEVYFVARIDGVDFDRPVAYSIRSAAAAVGYSGTTLRIEIREGRLRARYANSKAIILYDDLWKWAYGLPIWRGYEPRELRRPARRR